MIKELLGAGANLGIPNNSGETAMSLMGNVPPDIVEEILDSCVVGEGKGSEFHLALNFTFPNPAILRTKENRTNNVKGEGSKEGSSLEKKNERKFE